jgi:hypothetical protein
LGGLLVGDERAAALASAAEGGEPKADAPGFNFMETFTTLGQAETFFKKGDTLDLGSMNAGSEYVDISYYLTGSGSARGFGFNFNVDPPGGAVPEPSTWAMMLLGFGDGELQAVEARPQDIVTEQIQEHGLF